MTERNSGEFDYDVRRFAEMLTELPAPLPISSWFEESDPQECNRWWASQREHLIFFFMEGLFPNPYYLIKKGNRPRSITFSSKKRYQVLRHAEAFIWLAEALHIKSQDELKDICKEALDMPRRQRRKHIFKQFPWNEVVKHAMHRPELAGFEQTTEQLDNAASNYPGLQPCGDDVVDEPLM